MVVFGTSLSMAIFPTLSEKIARRDFEGFGHYFTKTLRSIIFFIVPISAGVILLRAQIVRLILGSGHFGWEQTIDTANALGYFAIALVFSSLVPLLARSFYAFSNTKIPVIATILTVIISIIAGYLLSPIMGVSGLALAFSIGAFFNASILYLIIRTKIKIPEWSIIWFGFKIIVASLIMAAAIQETKFIMAIFVDMQRFWGVLLQTLVATSVALIIYLTLAWIFNCEEIKSLKMIWRTKGRFSDQEPGR